MVKFPFEGISEFIDYCYNNSWFEKILNGESIIFDNTRYPNPMFSVQTQSSLFRKLLISCSYTNWVDIENEFYEDLKAILIKSDKKNRKKDLSNLNTTLENIINLLEKYLKSIDISKPLNGYQDIFDCAINEEDIVFTKLGEDDLNYPPDDTLFLNFNYTQTLEKYLDRDFEYEKKYTINYIHGQLNDTKNPLIFGFGDELDDYYLKMELEDTNDFFQYIKSFWYFKTSNYHNIIRFIDSGLYQVCVLGHSCGLSDRTMLNMIFENDNCVSIKIYYHGNTQNNNYTTLTQEISRHFRNKGIMRRKIVPFDKSESMPQMC